MINLLPAETKDTYRYARHNRALLRWITACVCSILGGAVLAGGGYLYLNRSITDTNLQITNSNKQLQSQHLGTVQKQVTSISNNLRLTVQVLSQEILFSELLKQLASVTPSNVVLTNLAITQAQGGVDITAQTGNYSAATQLQLNLADPKNQIFSQADIVSINCTTTGKYPCTATLRALFSSDNPFLFIHDPKGAKP